MSWILSILRQKTLMITREFDVFAGLHEEADKGWIWLYDKKLKSRRTIKITNPKTGGAIYCEYRALDDNFICLYNERPHTKKINPLGKISEVIIINEWYRLALKDIKMGHPAPFVVEQGRGLFSLWAGIKAGRHHPDPGVRMTTGLVILGTWLGVAGLLFAAVPEHQRIWAWLGSGLAALISYGIGRGTRWSNE